MTRHHCLHTLGWLATAILALVPIMAGCKSKPQPQGLELIPANAFSRGWQLDLEQEKDQIRQVHLAGDTLFAYTKNNRVYAVSASGGELLALMQPAPPGAVMRPPVALKDNWIIPTTSTFEIFNRNGRLSRSIDLQRATRGPATGFDHFLYVGLDYPGSGRLAKIDIDKAYARTIWELHTFGAVSSAPAVLEDAVYVASEDGRVYAMNPERRPIWAIEGGVFRAAGPIEADLKADENNVYVASADGHLYALDRLTGRIRWRYVAGAPLRSDPVVTDTAVYILVPNKGLVSIDKNTGKDYREPNWVSRGSRSFLSADDKYVYVLWTDNHIVALDIKTGEPKFKSQRNDLTIFTTNTRDATIYGATPAGHIIAIKPVTTPGNVGLIVLREIRFGMRAG